MIFSNFFKAKWQHKDANVRLDAIANELSLDEQGDRDILQTLAKEDKNDNVRKAALLKLNDLSLYQEILQNNNDAQQSFAQKQIELCILKNNAVIDSNTKQQLTELFPKSFLDSWLLAETDIEITKRLYQKIAKPQLAVSLFSKKQDAEFQLFLLNDTQDIALLEKLAKKTTVEQVQQTINKRIADIITAQEKPVQLAKSVQLTLSKLLALKDSTIAYDKLLAKRTTLENEWETYCADFSCLTTEQQTTFEQKYSTINQQLDKLFAPKAELYQQAQIEKQLQAEKDQARQGFKLQISQLEQTLANAVFENNDLTGTEFETQLNQLPAQIKNSVLNQQEQSDFLANIELLQKKLQQLPVIAQSVTDATHLISKISQLTLPTTIEEVNERAAIFNTWQKQWQQVEKQSIGTLPDSLKTAKQQIVKQWQAGLAPFYGEQKNLLNQARKNIADLNRLIASGKFNPCFGIYKKFKATFILLSESQQAKLQRDFDNLTEKMAELADWEHYIATPRKQELLDQIKALVTTPLDNPNDQANKVKAYRKQWNSLGHADDDIEKSLNDEFNQACEEAFAPCRQFYAEQEKIREQHAQVRQSIIAEVEQLNTSLTSTPADAIDHKALEGQLNKLNKAWRDAGEVDRAQYQRLQKQYNQALTPIKNVIHQFHHDNAKLKQALIVKAKACLTNEDIFAAVNEVKQLQSQWRELGYAGPKQESSLWQTFRQTNDAIFAKRDENKQAQSAAQAEMKKGFEIEINNLASEIEGLTKLAEFKEALSKAQALLQTIINNKPVIKSLANQVDKMIASLEKSIADLQKNKSKQVWQNLFELLNQLCENTTNDELTSLAQYQKLSNFWQKKLVDIAKSNKKGDRLSKTLVIEILGGIESPQEEADQRLAIQVKLMQEQMLSGGNVDLQALFIEWLQLGALTPDDKPLLARIKPLFC